MTEIPFAPCPELCTILPLSPLRKTEGVSFDSLPTELLLNSNGGERVLHNHGAQSPGPVGDVEHPWYCHKAQDDHLLVLAGHRWVELYHPDCKQIYKFRVSSHSIALDNDVIYEGGAILRWKAGVFHRIVSSKSLGSASLNFAIRNDGFDLQHEFDIHDLTIETGESRVIREGYLDQLRKE